MPSPALLRYFESLQCCNLQEINDELRQFCLGGPHISLFKDDGVLVAKHVFSDDNIANVNEINGCLHAIPRSHSWGKLQHIGAEAQKHDTKGNMKRITIKRTLFEVIMHIQISKQTPILPWRYKWSMGHPNGAKM